MRKSYSGGKRETVEGRLGSETISRSCPALGGAGLLLVLLAAFAVTCPNCLTDA